LQNNKQIFLLNNEIKKKNVSILINTNKLYYLTLHLKLSSFFYSNQLIDIFSYESIVSNNTQSFEKLSLKKNNESIVVYNFNVLKNNTRVFLFTLNQNRVNRFKNMQKKNYL